MKIAPEACFQVARLGGFFADDETGSAKHGHDGLSFV